LASLIKSRFYLIQGRVILHKVQRTTKNNRWPSTSVPTNAILLLEITPNPKGMDIKRHNGCTREHEIEAILMFQGKFNYDESTSLALPESLISNVEEHVSNSINRIVSRYQNFASEDMVTAAFGDRIQEAFYVGSSNVDITFQSYSSSVKEPINGADLSVIFDMQDAFGRRVIKTILIQAKRCKNSNANVKGLPDLAEQIEKMNGITDENYVLLYHDSGFNVFKSSEPESRGGMDLLFGEVMRCNNGDKSKSVLASSLDSKHVIQLIVSE